STEESSQQGSLEPDRKTKKLSANPAAWTRIRFGLDLLGQSFYQLQPKTLIRRRDLHSYAIVLDRCSAFRCDRLVAERPGRGPCPSLPPSWSSTACSMTVHPFCAAGRRGCRYRHSRQRNPRRNACAACERVCCRA